MNARGLLNSSITIKNAHGVLTAEFEANRILITKTILDHIRSLDRIANKAEFENCAQSQLSERKNYLEQALKSGFSNVLSGLPNPAMVAPLMHLDDLYSLAQYELTIELKSAIDTHNKSFGSNLTEQLKNRFLNNPILAIFVLSVAGATFIIGFLRLIEAISFG